MAAATPRSPTPAAVRRRDSPLRCHAPRSWSRAPCSAARHTAEAFGVPVTVDERWIELDYGDLDGQLPAAVSEGMWQRWRTDASYAPPGGESLMDLGNRVRAACADLSDAAVDVTVVVVTHVSPIKAAVAWALDVPDGIAWRMYVEDASVTRIDIEPAGPVVRWFNRGVLRDD